MHYFTLEGILLVGEGNFPFSSILAKAFALAFNIIAASLLEKAFAPAFNMVTTSLDSIVV